MTDDQRRRAVHWWWSLRLFGLPQVVRDLWNLVLTILVLLAILSASGKADRAQVSSQRTAAEQAQQKQGRKIAVAVTCGALSGVIDAGRGVLLQQVQPREFRRALERVGLPRGAAARRARREAAAGYSRLIAVRVEQVSGVRGIVDPVTGELRCDRLAQLGQTH